MPAGGWICELLARQLQRHVSQQARRARLMPSAPTSEDDRRDCSTDQPHGKRVDEAQEQPVAPVNASRLVKLALRVVLPGDVHEERRDHYRGQKADERRARERLGSCEPHLSPRIHSMLLANAQVQLRRLEPRGGGAMAPGNAARRVGTMMREAPSAATPR
jgi:hypothetical protein